MKTNRRNAAKHNADDRLVVINADKTMMKVERVHLHVEVGAAAIVIVAAVAIAMRTVKTNKTRKAATSNARNVLIKTNEETARNVDRAIISRVHVAVVAVRIR